jgi:hypothetical protein
MTQLLVSGVIVSQVTGARFSLGVESRWFAA